MTESMTWEKFKTMAYTTPEGVNCRGVLIDPNGDGHEFAYEWLGEMGGKVVDLVAFVERGWRPVLELNDNCRGTFFVYTGEMVRGKDRMHVPSMNVYGTVVDKIAHCGKFETPRTAKEA